MTSTSFRSPFRRFDSDEWQHGWRLAVGVICSLAAWVIPVGGALGLFLWYLSTVQPPVPAPPVRWHGLDRSAVLCDSDSWLTDDRMTCVGAERRWLCVREVRDYECVEVTRAPTETP